jgi:hypothetical protein
MAIHAEFLITIRADFPLLAAGSAMIIYLPAFHAVEAFGTIAPLAGTFKRFTAIKAEAEIVIADTLIADSTVLIARCFDYFKRHAARKQFAFYALFILFVLAVSALLAMLRVIFHALGTHAAYHTGFFIFPLVAFAANREKSTPIVFPVRLVKIGHVLRIRQRARRSQH